MDYIGKGRLPLIGSRVFIENNDGADWRGVLLDFTTGWVLIEEEGVRKMIPMASIMDIVFTDDVKPIEKDTKPYKL